ncbi:site-specific integrase [Clostridia bacterium]|nr:site-specific integrase [Clostridia bacterium]
MSNSKPAYPEPYDEPIAVQCGNRVAAAKGEILALKDWASGWVNTYRQGISDTTREDYNQRVKQIVDQIGEMLLDAITLDSCQKYINQFTDQSVSTIRKNAQILAALMESARQSRLIFDNPTNGMRIPRGKKGTHKYLTPDTQRIILQTWMGHRCGAAAMLMLFSGLRRGEALAFDVSHDIDMQCTQINVQRALRFVGNNAQFGPPKSKAGIRSIPIMEVLKPVFTNLEDKPSVLPKLNGDTVTKSSFRKAWASYQRYLCKHGCTQIVRCHDLRHTFATMLAQAGVSIKVMQAWLGHASALMSMDIYAHVTSEQVVIDTQLLSAYLVNIDFSVRL